jgi:hypothetical protein
MIFSLLAVLLSVNFAFSAEPQGQQSAPAGFLDPAPVDEPNELRALGGLNIDRFTPNIDETLKVQPLSSPALALGYVRHLNQRARLGIMVEYLKVKFRETADGAQTLDSTFLSLSPRFELYMSLFGGGRGPLAFFGLSIDYPLIAKSTINVGGVEHELQSEFNRPKTLQNLKGVIGLTGTLSKNMNWVLETDMPVGNFWHFQNLMAGANYVF